MKQLIVVSAVAFILLGCGVADVTSGAGELADTGDRLVAAVEGANRTVAEQRELNQWNLGQSTGVKCQASNTRRP